ncbi:MAG: hypothetical protein IKY27_09435 [Bacteroidales bacterium]|nr:hypothetical protein [Bacteroidales bacterium]
MRIILVFILLAFGFWPSAVNGQQTSCTVPEPVEGTTSGASTSSATSYPRTVDRCPLSVDFNCAKAHYYHAVGLTERDDIVGACEHYLIALEIMEEMMANGKSLKTKGKKSVDNNEDYEKIRFVALIYTRLGEIFLNESCCDLSIVNYKKVLYYCESFNDTYFISQTLKYLGYSYQLSDNVDSALYYYNRSLKTISDIGNKLDVEKCIAQILYYKGESDSAFLILKNNLNKITNEDVKYSYHCTLGNFFLTDKKYDSALYYLEESLNNNIITKKIAFTTTLSAIYDSLGNYEKKAYYDNFSANLLKNSINKEVDKSKIQVLYNDYNERKAENTRIKAKARTRRITMMTCLGAIIAIMFIFIYIRYNYKKQNDKLKGDINDYAKENKRLIDDFKKSNDKKDKIIKQQKKEISEIKNQFNNATGFNLQAYYDSDICKNILSRKDSDFSCLKEDELALLLKSANLYLNNISVRLSEQFPTLNHNDIYTICLIILNVEKNKLPHLLSRDRKTIWDRLNKIRRLMNIDAKQDLFIHIRDNYLH